MENRRLDVTSEPAATSSATSASCRPYLGVHFACCSVYARVYMCEDRTAYLGHCPRCGKPLQIKIGPGGTDARFFTAY